MLRARYDSIANQCRLEITNFDVTREQRILDANNLGAFYRFVNKKLSSKSGIAPLMNVNGDLIFSDTDKAELLNQYFTSVFTVDDGNLPVFQSRLSSSSPGINDINTSPSKVRSFLGHLKLNSAAGPDRIPSIFYRKASTSLCFPLSILFRSLIDLHDLPSEWKHSFVTPIYKKGSPSAPSNYRPIALTCSCCKILESLIVSDLLYFLQSHNLISKHQHGFLKHHSTCSNLLESLNDWTLSLSNRKSVVVAYIDFARASNSISYPKQFIKLEAYGIGGNLLFWIKSFLIHRTQSVRVGSSMSSVCSVTSGIPQGSCLGPLLFILYINDVTDGFVGVSAKLFADDLKLYTEIDTDSSEIHFQSHLDILFSWASSWQLGISYSKCCILRLGRDPSQFPFSFNNTPIVTSDLVKDLGVYMTPDLSFASHIHDFVSRAKLRSALIFRSFLTRNTANLKRAFITYVRPLLEYTSPVWSPSHLYLINEIENVQRSFTKRLPGLSTLSYSERLSILNLPTLEYGRLIADLIICFNIVHGFSCMNTDSFFTLSRNSSLRGHQFRSRVPLSKSNLRKFFFAHRVVQVWNSLPASIVAASSTRVFKSLVMKLDLSKFLQIVT